MLRSQNLSQQYGWEESIERYGIFIEGIEVSQYAKSSKERYEEVKFDET